MRRLRRRSFLFPWVLAGLVGLLAHVAEPYRASAESVASPPVTSEVGSVVDAGILHEMQRLLPDLDADRLAQLYEELCAESCSALQDELTLRLLWEMLDGGASELTPVPLPSPLRLTSTVMGSGTTPGFSSAKAVRTSTTAPAAKRVSTRGEAERLAVPSPSVLTARLPRGP